MPKCPHADHELVIPENAELNMYHYHEQVVVVTKCCKKPVWAWPVTIYRAEIYTGAAEHDDWGTPIKKAAA